MVWVLVVVGIGHEPFVHTKDAAGFEDAVYLGVDTFEGGSVDGGFDGVDGVKGGVWEGHLLWSVRRILLSCVFEGERTMKSPFVKLNWCESLSFAAYLVARSIW